MNNHWDRIIITVNSSHRISLNGSYKSDLLFNFIGLLKQENTIEQVQISLVNAQIPVSFYTINYTNNVFKIKLGDNAITCYCIQVGNYNDISLISALNTF